MRSGPYQRISILDPRLLRDIDGGGARVQLDKQLFPASTLMVPKIAFGDTLPENLGVSENDAAALWGEGPLSCTEVYSLRIKNAVVHPPFGIITIGDFVIDETLGHIPFHDPGYGISDQEVLLPNCSQSAKLYHALHAAAGNYTNYFHWMLDTVPKMRVSPLAESLSDGTIILPPIATSAQSDIVSIVGRGPNPLLVLGKDHTVCVESLTFVPNLTSQGFRPNPYLRGFFDQIKSLVAPESSPQRLIYVTRQDSPTRVMRNEAEVISFLYRRGFKIVELSKLSLREQIEIFDKATHIIAPHGAGLTNLVFCRPGVSVCELHMNKYVPPFYHRLAGIQNLKYGCLVGKTDEAFGLPEWPSTMVWDAPIDRLERVVSEWGLL